MTPTCADALTELHEILRTKGLTKLDAPVRLAAGDWSRFFIDGKAALGAGADLRLAAEVIVDRVGAAGVRFDAAGGLTLGADALSAAIAVVSGANWFIVRKEPKGRGTNRLIEGCRIGEGTQVLLVDDVVTSGSSMLAAYDRIRATGAHVVAAVTLVDRGGDAREAFDERGVPYLPMATYEDMGIPAIGTEPADVAAA